MMQSSASGKKMRMHCLDSGKAKYVAFIIPFLFFPGLALSDNMSFSGVLISSPSCTINNGKTIEIDFGERIGINKIDGQSNMRDVNYKIACEPGASNGLGLTVSGNATGYDSAALQTNIDGLGVKLLLNGQRFEINKRVLIDEKLPPLLQVVLVKKPGAELKAGSFTSAATLLADYP